MKQETKNCQNCKQDFTIEPEDFNFYEKIKVPPPTFCPECRMKRRMSWRNDWHLFKKKDALTGDKIFSLFPEESLVKVYDRDYWWSDKWDPFDYSREYDFSRPFFEQFQELLYTVPLPSQSIVNTVNCKYCANASNAKSCYFSAGLSYTEECAYVIWDHGSKQCFDSHMTYKCELSYGNVNTTACYKTFFSVDCESCHDMILSKDCVGCNNCIASVGLRNKSYCIFNKQYNKEEYNKKLEELNLGSEKSFQILKEKAYKYWQTFPQKYIHGYHNVDVSGDYIYESKNAKNCYRVKETEDIKFSQNILKGPVRDVYDFTNWGDNAELIYEAMIVGTGASNIKFCVQTYNNVKNLTYCIFCHSSSDLFGCVSLKNKQYCIFNKQYTKEAYEELLPKIIEHMKNTSEYGEFFPSFFSFFPYRITQAYEFFPLNKKEVETEGFIWYETPKQNYQITLDSSDIPDNIKDVDKNIVNEAIGCAHGGTCEHECTSAFRVIESEVDFCKRISIPLPHLCPNCRHYERLKQRNPLKLWHRKCMKEGCTNEFETSYAPDRPEIVYCEKCYQQEVY